MKFREIFCESTGPSTGPRTRSRTRSRTRKIASTKKSTSNQKNKKIEIGGEEFTPKTNSAIIKDVGDLNNFSYRLFRGLLLSKKDLSRAIVYLKPSIFVKEKVNKLSDKEQLELLEKLLPGIIKFSESRVLRKALLEKHEKDAKELGYKTRKLMEILNKGSNEDLANFEVDDIVVDVERDEWSSSRGSHTTSTNIGRFWFDDKEYEIDLGSSTVGTSW